MQLVKRYRHSTAYFAVRAVVRAATTKAHAFYAIAQTRARSEVAMAHLDEY